MKRVLLIAVAGLAVVFGAFASGANEVSSTVSGYEKIGAFDSGLGEGAAEIVVYSADHARLFVVNAAQTSVDILDISDPARPELVRHVDIAAYGASANSVAVHGDYLAVAVEAEEIDEAGTVVLLNTDGGFVSDYPAGVLPDMVTFSPDGRYLLAANEGEPSDDYAIDPEGSVTIIDLRDGHGAAQVEQVSFRRWNARVDELTADSVRVFGPGATVAEDLEPEYIAVSNDSRRAYVAMQENNAIAEVDLRSATVTAIHGLGFKDHSLQANAFDPSNRDGGIRFTTAPVMGIYLPDAIAGVTIRGRDYILTANEGDARDYDGYSEEVRVADLELDPTAYPNAAELQDDAELGRLKTTTALGDTDGDGDIDQIYSYGGRSMSIWEARGGSLRMVADTGDQIERFLARRVPAGFNANDGIVEEFDERSDDKGPEPEAVVAGRIAGRTYAFVGLERALGGVVVFDITDPRRPEIVEYILSNDGSGDGDQDIAPEGLVFIPASESPSGAPLVVASYEVSGTVGIYEVVVTPTRR